MVRRILTAGVVLALAFLASGCNGKEADAQMQEEVLPISGTWVNLAWQDERNLYMNSQDEAVNTDPALWTEKMAEMHEIGVDYIVLMQVANEGSAYYPSDFMPHYFPDGRKSPVEAIMDACDSLDMHVFLSCGWAKDQDDNVGDSAIVALQCRIMRELASAYGERKSFYGWYLPIEDCLIPYLPERSVNGINRLTSLAHELTPGGRTMVAPYGIFGAELDNPLFRSQLAKIDVDIIAYQDEIGCVRERFPMRRMKENFRKLGEIHRDLGIEFWVDMESFTWDRGTNSRQSALIPAQFGRVLSQMAGATQAGVQRIMSFAICGIWDKPGSQHPLGQPDEASNTYRTYQSWLEADARWKFLEDIFMGRAENDARGAKVYYASAFFNGEKEGDAFLPLLTDGEFGYEDAYCPQLFKSARGLDIVIDLGAVHKITSLAPHFLEYAPDFFMMPAEVTVSTSLDGKEFKRMASAPGPGAANALHDCWTDISYFNDLGQARYIRLECKTDEWSAIALDEVFISY